MNPILQNRPLDQLHFDNSFTRELPADPEEKNFRRQVQHACFSRVEPQRVTDPRLVAYSREVAELLDLDATSCTSQLFTDVFVGNSILPGMEPHAMCYGGHQFGSWAGQLGDGRAINLGEVINKNNQRWALQLKGAGPTPYSRSADGLAVLRSSIREFLCSEAMHHLGIPTTRALSIISTGESVLRDMLYDGHPAHEPGAVVCRVALSFVRFGHFEILAARNEQGLLKQLADYTIANDFPHLGQPSKETYLAWFQEICDSTVKMILDWMRVGFVHGVMNTDNMSILGLSIDYGPYGWLEGYDANWTPNTTDALGRRYCYSNQPHIGQWNLTMLANALYPLIEDKAGLENVLKSYNSQFQSGWNSMMAAKIGFLQFQPATDDRLIGDLIDILHETETDMTIFFRKLADVPFFSDPANIMAAGHPLTQAHYLPEQMNQGYVQKMNVWLEHYLQRLQSETQSRETRMGAMNAINPKYVLRNYLAQRAIDKATDGDNSLVNELLEVMRSPYNEQPDMEKYAGKRPEWARNKPGCSMLSCSS